MGSVIVSSDPDDLPFEEYSEAELAAIIEEHKPKIATSPAIVVCDENRDLIELLFRRALPEYSVGVDCETNTANPKEPNAMKDTLVGVGIAFYLDDQHVQTFYGDVLQTPWWHDLLAETLPNHPYYAHNALYDATVLRRHGIRLGPLAGDGRIAAYLQGEPEAGLKSLLEKWLHVDTMEFWELLDAHGVKRISEVPVEAVAKYCGEQDAQLCVPLARAMAAKLPDRVRQVYEKVELPMVGILLDMTMRGIKFNREKAVPMLDGIIKAREGLDTVIASMIRATGFTQYEMKDGLPYQRTCPVCHNGKKKRIGCEQCQGEGHQAVRLVDFNPGSPDQVRAFLYEHLKLPTRRYAGNVKPWMITKGYVEVEDLKGSTDALALLQLQGAHPVIPVMLSRRHFKKDEQFVTSWIAASEEDGRIHGQMTNTVVASGRLSMHDPNLQQVTLRFRNLFEAD